LLEALNPDDVTMTWCCRRANHRASSLVVSVCSSLILGSLLCSSTIRICNAINWLWVYSVGSHVCALFLCFDFTDSYHSRFIASLFFLYYVFILLSTANKWRR